MNVLHCNECGGTNDVAKVEITSERMVPQDGMLAKPVRTKVEGDLCETCLKVVNGMVDENAGQGLKLADARA